MRFLLTFFFFTAALLAGSYSYATEYTIEIGWTIEETEGIELAGFCLYDHQQVMVCETTAPAETMICTVDIPGTEATFTLVSYSTDGVESDHSDPFVIVFEEPLPLEAVISKTQTEGSLTVNFDASASTGQITQYSWNFNDGSQLDSNAITNHTFPAPGTYTIALTVQDENATSTTEQEVTLTQSSGDNQPPTAALSADPANGISPLIVTFNAGGSSDPDGDALTYSWNFGDGITADDAGSEIVHTYVVPTTGTISYTATVTVADSQSSSTADLPIMVTNDGSGGGATPTATITASRTSGPAPVTVTFSGADSTPSEQPTGTITQYSWDFGDGSTGSGLEVQHTFTDPGSYTVELTVTDSNVKQGVTTMIIVAQTPGAQNNVPVLIQVYDLLLLKN